MKKSKLTAIAACAYAMFWLGCTSDNKPSAPITEAPKTETAPATTTMAKPEMYLYAIRFDAMQMRETPDLKGKVVTKISLGDFVEGTNEKSSNKVSANLGGMEWTEPFYKVKGLTPEAYQGWIFGGGILPIYAGSRANSPDLGKLTQLATHLKGLKTKQLNSGQAAWSYVETNFANANGSLADAAFILLEDFMHRMETEGEYYTMTEKIKFTDADFTAIYDNTFDMNKYPITKSLAQNGFTVGSGEGMVFPLKDLKKFKAFFAGKASPATNQYIDYVLAEQLNPTLEDAGIVIPLNALADRAAQWEKFNRENPYFPMEDATESRRWTLGYLLTGANNTPTFGYDDGKKIVPEFKSMYEYVIKTYPDTEMGKTVKTFYDLCAAENWSRTAKVEAFQTKYWENQ